jgi:hypothetical protein
MDFSSYHLMLGGTFLITLSLFMLSLCQPQQFYAVSQSFSSVLTICIEHGTGVSLPWPGSRYWEWSDICPLHKPSLPLFQTTTNACIWYLVSRLSTGRFILPDLAQSPLAWLNGLSQRCQSHCRAELRSSCHSGGTHEAKATANQARKHAPENSEIYP